MYLADAFTSQFVVVDTLLLNSTIGPFNPTLMVTSFVLPISVVEISA